MKVARLYRFKARHSLEGVAGYDHMHEHDYTVEIVVSQFNVPKDGFVIDTQRIDNLMDPLARNLTGTNLNDFVCPSTVENLALEFRARLHNALKTQHGITVKVWEDNDRWGATL